MRLRTAAFEHHDLDDPQPHRRKDAGEHDTGKKEPGAAAFEGPSRRPVGHDRGTGWRFEVPRPAWTVVKRLGCEHYRLAMIWAIRSSSDFARCGAAAFTDVFTGIAAASCGAPAGFSNSAGITRSALCVRGGSATAVATGGAAAA